MYGTANRVFLQHRLLWGLLLLLGAVSVNGANVTYEMRIHNVSGVTANAGAAGGTDSPPSSFWSSASTAAGAFSSYGAVNSVGHGVTVYARTRANGGSYGSWVGIGVTDTNAGANNQFTVTWDGTDVPGGASNYYTKCFTVTNRMNTSIYPNVTMHDATGDHALDEPFFTLPPGGSKPYCVTNNLPFTVTWGDPQFFSDTPQQTVTGDTNTTYQSPPGNATGTGSLAVGGVTGNSSVASGGSGLGNTSGTTNAPTVQNLYIATDAMINAMARNTDRLLAQLELNRTSSSNNSSGGSSPDYSGLLGTIKTNTGTSADWMGNVSRMMSNMISDGDSWAHGVSNQALVSGSNAVWWSGYGSSNWSSLNVGSSVTSSVSSLISGLTPSVPASIGMIQISNYAGNVVQEIDFQPTMNGSGWNAYLGSGWRGWFRPLLAWLLLLGLLMWTMNQLRAGLRDALAVAALSRQVAPSWGGPVSAAINLGLRATLTAAFMAVVITLPALIVTLFGSMSGYSGSGIATAVANGAASAASNLPVMVGYAFSMFNQWLPLQELVVCAINYVGARLSIDSAVAALVIFNKVFGPS